MSVMIKGMQLSDGCNESDLLQIFDENETSICPLSPYYVWSGVAPDYRPDGCPLVEIPTPHGRLIDADELLKHKYGISQTARTYIKTADTVIEAEVSE